MNHLCLPPLGAKLASWMCEGLDWVEGDVPRKPAWASERNLTLAKKLRRLLRGFEARGVRGYEKIVERMLEQCADDVGPLTELTAVMLKPQLGNDRSTEWNPAFSNRPDRYDILFEKLQLTERPEEWAIISLNYDLLAEQALSRLEICPRYSFHPPAERSVLVLKPHGSSNWQLNEAMAMQFSMSSPDTEGKDAFSRPLYAKFHVSATNPAEVQSIDVVGQRGKPVHPQVGDSTPEDWSMPTTVMAHYTRGKSASAGMLYLDVERRRALRVAACAEKSLIVGMAIPSVDDDAPVRYMLEATQGKVILYVSPEPPSTVWDGWCYRKMTLAEMLDNIGQFETMFAD